MRIKILEHWVVYTSDWYRSWVDEWDIFSFNNHIQEMLDESSCFSFPKEELINLKYNHI